MAGILQAVKAKSAAHLAEARAAYRAILWRDLEGTGTDNDAVVMAELLPVLGIKEADVAAHRERLRSYRSALLRVKALPASGDVDGKVQAAAEILQQKKAELEAANEAYCKALGAYNATFSMHRHEDDMRGALMDQRQRAEMSGVAWLLEEPASAAS